MASLLSETFNPEPYWAVVEDCLVELHGLDRIAAGQRVADLRAWIAAPPDGVDGEIVYHSEQFDVASELAGRLLKIDDCSEQYHRIVDRHYPGWRAESPVPTAAM